MSLPATIDPRFHTEANLAQARVDYVVATVFNPATMFPPCDKCGSCFELHRQTKLDKQTYGCWWVQCSNRDCKPFVYMALRFPNNRDTILKMNLGSAWNNCLLFNGFPDPSSVNPSAVPKIPGFREPTTPPTPVFPTTE